MSFAVADFTDFLAVLRAHPEWQAELRHILLEDELAEIRRAIEQSRAEFEASLARLTARLERMDEQYGAFRSAGDSVAHAQLRLGEGMIMVGTGESPAARGFRPNQNKSSRATTSSCLTQTRTASARRRPALRSFVDRSPLTTASREYAAVDPEGYYRSFGTYHPVAEPG